MLWKDIMIRLKSLRYYKDKKHKGYKVKRISFERNFYSKVPDTYITYNMLDAAYELRNIEVLGTLMSDLTCGKCYLWIFCEERMIEVYLRLLLHKCGKDIESVSY